MGNRSQLRPDDVVAFIDSPQEDVAEVNRAYSEEEPPPLEIVCHRERRLRMSDSERTGPCITPEQQFLNDLWEEHVHDEFVARDTDATLATNAVPSATTQRINFCIWSSRDRQMRCNRSRMARRTTRSGVLLTFQSRRLFLQRRLGIHRTRMVLAACLPATASRCPASLLSPSVAHCCSDSPQPWRFHRQRLRRPYHRWKCNRLDSRSCRSR